MSNDTWFWSTAGGFFFAGLAIGLLIGGLTNTYRRHAHYLGKELEKSRQELSDYQRQVTAHFAGSAELFNALTTSYQAVHHHLANGCQELCRGDVPRLKSEWPAECIAIATQEKLSDARTPATTTHHRRPEPVSALGVG